MLECPDCGRGFEPDAQQYLRFLTLGAIYCPQCSTRCEVVIRQKRRCPCLSMLRIVVLSGLFLCVAYLALHALFFCANPWLLLDVPKNRAFMLATCSGAAIFSLVFLAAGYFGQRSLLNSPDRELALRTPSPLADDECPICRSEPAHNAIVFGETRVCAQCKDEYIQRLKEGIAGS